MHIRGTPMLPEHRGPLALRRVQERLCERSGRTLLLRFEDDSEALDVLAPDGTLELTITLTADGPILRLRSASVELIGSRTVAVRCGRFEVAATEGVAIHADGDIVHSTKGRAVVDAKDVVKSALGRWSSRRDRGTSASKPTMTSSWRANASISIRDSR